MLCFYKVSAVIQFILLMLILFVIELLLRASPVTQSLLALKLAKG